MSRLRISSAPEIAERLASEPLPRWLVRGLWPSGAYGIVASQPKVGKSFLAEDLAVSVASGSPFLDRFPIDDPGGVLLLLGEDSDRSVLRRLEAIARSRGGSVSTDLSELRISTVPIELSSPEDMTEVRGALAAHPVKLLIVDPLYVAAAGAKGTDIYEMGRVLKAIQAVAAEADCSLVVTHHLKKSAEPDDGLAALWGAGPGAWGRVIAVGSVEGRTTETNGTSVVRTSWAFAGSEIPDTTVRVLRRVRAADPENLGSPLSYRVEVLDGEGPAGEGGPPADELSWSDQRVLRALRGGKWMSLSELGDAAAADGSKYALKRDTIRASLESLTRRGMVIGEGGRWRAADGQAALDGAGTGS